MPSEQRLAPPEQGGRQADAVPAALPARAADPRVDLGPVAAGAAVGGGRSEPEAAVDVLHGAADDVGHAGNGAGDDDGGDVTGRARAATRSWPSRWRARRRRCRARCSR